LKQTKIPDENPDLALDFKILMKKKYKDEDFFFNVLRIAKRNLGFWEKNPWTNPWENPDASRLRVLRIRDVYPGSDFFPSRIPDPGSEFFPSRITDTHQRI
jgi:hypothetical protein